MKKNWKTFIIIILFILAFIQWRINGLLIDILHLHNKALVTVMHDINFEASRIDTLFDVLQEVKNGNN